MVLSPFSYRWSDKEGGGGRAGARGGGGGSRAKAVDDSDRKAGLADGGLWGAAKSQWALYSQHGMSEIYTFFHKKVLLAFLRFPRNVLNF